MTIPDPITTAREALEELLLTATQKAADRDACENAVSKYQAVRSIFDHVEKLKAERDEALCRLLSAGSEKPTAEDMDWAISLSASLRREEIAVEDSEITRLTSQLEQAEKVIAPFAGAAKSLTGSEDDDAIIAPAFIDEPPLGSCDLVVCSVADIRAAAQWYKDRQSKGEG